MLGSEAAEEAMGEVDINGRNGPMTGCCWGFLGIVDLLCNYSGLDINQQDQVGNTALMTAAQAGADVKASQGRTAQDWALSAGRVETSPQIKWLLEQPCVEQVAVGYVPGSPAHKEPSVRAKAPNFQSEKITNQLKSMLRIKDPFNPQEGGVLEHMVRVTANPSSPFIATTCMNICPASIPNVRKHRGATPKIMRRFSLTQESASLLQSEHAKESVGVITPSVNSEERNGAKPKQGSRPINSRAAGVDPIDFLSLQLPIRNCAVATGCIPKIELISASPLTRKREKKQLPRNKNLLPLPKWKYKQMREERKAAKNRKEQLMEKNKRACKFSTSV
ncbi:ankyrin repeat domain-containing protein 33B-like [Pristis pectinata]|uniref:ankyrin repeat domain-containing protein 33B-like n=1 Tax=Pristis pectinata TaxID=685728 RepID=UPI00223DF643|nr:ankyrin repeat domain-containing protein 33B-like [Pristis pectinata]